nr:MAG TPA: hypothetical protein [Bacteriophage sp.]
MHSVNPAEPITKTGPRGILGSVNTKGVRYAQ